MKKCPKCGTILDDSKKSCYMCGTSLGSSNKLGFADAIDAAVGSTVTNEVDNVFNNGEDITVKSKDVVAKNNDSAFFGKDVDAFGVFSDSINSLNNIKSSDPNEQVYLEEKKALEEKNAMIAKEKEEAEKKKLAEAQERQRLREEKAKQRVEKREAMNANAGGGLFGISKENNNSQVFIENVPKNNIKPEINWGDNLKKENTGKNITVSKSSIFNIVCLLIFIGMLVFVYFKFLKEAPDTTIELGGLKYNISDEFSLKSSDNNSRYYAYGDSCSLKINYGTAENTNSFIDDYFESQKKTFLENDKYQAVNESMSINDNTWEVMKIVELVQSPGTASGVTEITKYRYVTIVHNGKYYTTIYVNLNNDSTCSAMYNNFVDTLEF